MYKPMQSECACTLMLSTIDSSIDPSCYAIRESLSMLMMVSVWDP